MHTARCPECNVTIPEVKPGSKIKCPACGATFQVPSGGRKRDWGDEDEPAPVKNTGRKTLLIVGGILLALLIVCGGIAVVGGYFVMRGIEAARQQAMAQVQQNQQRQAQIQAGGPAMKAPVPLDPEAQKATPIPLTLENGAVTHQNTLTPADLQFTGKPFKLYTVDLEQGKRYQIELASQQMDSYLRLYGPKDEPIAENDDFNGLDSGIVVTPDVAGTYKIHATVLGRLNNGPAPFTLTIRAE